MTTTTIQGSTLVSTLSYDECGRADMTTMTLIGFLLGSLQSQFNNVTGQLVARYGIATSSPYKWFPLWQLLNVDARGATNLEAHGDNLGAEFVYDHANGRAL